PVREAFERYGGDSAISRRWLDGMKVAFPFLMFAEYAANRTHARISRYCPAPALRSAAFYQSIDELRHSQNHLYQMKMLTQKTDGFDNWRHWRDHHFLVRPAKKTFEDLMACDNIFEHIFALNIGVEVTFTNLIFVGLPSVGALNGDTAMAQEMLTTQSDETRHMAIGQSTVRTLLRDERNLPLVQYWLDKWFWLHHRVDAPAVGTLVDYFAKRKHIPFKKMYKRYVVDNYLTGLVEDLAEFGVKKPWFLDTVERELDDYTHSLYRAMFQYKHVLFNKVFVPNDHDLEFFCEGYPTFEANHGRFWSQVRDGDPKDLPQLPMICQMCQLPCVFPTPEQPSVCSREYEGQMFWFCSEPCRWIFDNEPVRYSKAVTLDRILNGKDIPEIREYMGVDRNIGGLLEAEDDI
ncbi:MAG: YHS domain-containing protein, partial [Acidimicrobiia bacterium]